MTDNAGTTGRAAEAAQSETPEQAYLAAALAFDRHRTPRTRAALEQAGRLFAASLRPRVGAAADRYLTALLQWLEAVDRQERLLTAIKARPFEKGDPELLRSMAAQLEQAGAEFLSAQGALQSGKNLSDRGA